MFLMLNLIGIVIAFIGSFLTIVNIMTSNYKNDEITYDELTKLASEFRKQKKATLIGFTTMFVGFLFQLIAAYQGI